MFATPFRRLSVLLAAVPIACAVATPAHAAGAPSCPPDSDVVNTLGVRVAVHASGRMNVCVEDVAAGGLVVSFSLMASTPLVPLAISRAPGSCPAPLVYTSWPTEVSVSADAESLCIGLNGLTTTITYGPIGYSPDLEVWRTGRGGWIDTAFCLREYVDYLLYEPAYEQYRECAYEPHRIV